MNSDAKKQLTDNIKQNKNLYIFNGIMLLVLGIIALLAPLVAAEFLDILIGCLLFVTGLFQGVVSYAAKRHWTYYITAVISVIAGGLLILQPMAGMLALATIVAIFLLLQGCMQIFYAGIYAPFTGWIWMLLSGLVSIGLTAFIYVGWPITAIWFLGILVAINLISFGISMLVLATFCTRALR
ncbi:MAG TPA: DUF308 domain-containing protein [Gammaproteobacteria bacterium]|nr:DUF308 domain-containing protein [Gammaproteobacteria bacterium]